MKYEVKMRSKGNGNAFVSIAVRSTIEQALDEVKYLHTLEEDGEYEYLISESHD